MFKSIFDKIAIFSRLSQLDDDVTEAGKYALIAAAPDFGPIGSSGMDSLDQGHCKY